MIGGGHDNQTGARPEVRSPASGGHRPRVPLGLRELLRSRSGVRSERGADVPELRVVPFPLGGGYPPGGGEVKAGSSRVRRPEMRGGAASCFLRVVPITYLYERDNGSAGTCFRSPPIGRASLR